MTRGKKRDVDVSLFGLGALAVAVIALSAFALTRFPSAEGNAGSTPGYTPPPSPQAQPVAVFFGDSYVAGVGASSPQAAYPALTGSALGWQVTPLGLGGTGFVNPGPEGRVPYGDRVDEITQAAPDVVVIQGSGNDAGTSSREITAAARDVIDRIRQGSPEATVVVVGPMWSGDRPEKLPVCRDAVKAAADQAGVPFIDPLAAEWLTDDDMGPDGAHPTDAGHAKIANRLAADLQVLGLSVSAG